MRCHSGNLNLHESKVSATQPCFPFHVKIEGTELGRYTCKRGAKQVVDNKKKEINSSDTGR